MIYSPSNNCFFDPENTTALPTDAVTLTATQYEALIEGVLSGQTLTPNGTGVPTLAGVPGSPPKLPD